MFIFETPKFDKCSLLYCLWLSGSGDYFDMRSRNTEDHLTPEGVPGNKSGYGEKSAVIFSTIDDDTRVIPAVEFRNVKFAYGDQIVLNDISFRVMRGELLIVLSPSGGGKSTILKLALGLMSRTRDGS